MVYDQIKEREIVDGDLVLVVYKLSNKEGYQIVTGMYESTDRDDFRVIPNVEIGKITSRSYVPGSVRFGRQKFVSIRKLLSGDDLRSLVLEE